MRSLLFVLAVSLLFHSRLFAQHTFSIIAVDPMTGEIGSAGASCIGIDVRIISDVHPGIGAVHTQAFYRPSNQAYGRTLMEMGRSPQEIVDSLVAHDEQGTPGVRQYGVVTLAGETKSAAYTGSESFDYKSHILGPTYSIQGNTLLGQSVLDSMEARFLREDGPLAERLMAALQGANVPGADNRCTGVSSMGAFIRVASPANRSDSLYLDLAVTYGIEGDEPIDSLQVLFNRWAGITTDTDFGLSAERGVEMQVILNPGSPGVRIRYDLDVPASVLLEVFDELGNRVAGLVDRREGVGRHDVIFDALGLSAGIYYCRLTSGVKMVTRKLMIAATRE